MVIPASLQAVFSLSPPTPNPSPGAIMNCEKSILLTYILWFFFGFHYLYLGKIGIQLIFFVILVG